MQLLITLNFLVASLNAGMTRSLPLITSSLRPGQKVLVLLPVAGKPLEAKYQGPYIISSRIGDVDYWVDMPDKKSRLDFCM